jgi:competence protein ComEC
MASAATTPGDYREAPDADAFLPRSVWRAPLVPAALAFTAGIILDRYLSVPLGFSLAAAAVCLAAWIATSLGSGKGLPLVYLALAGVAFGTAYHHLRRDLGPQDVAHLAGEEPRTVRVRGVLDEEPFHAPALPHDALRSRDRADRSSAVVRLTHLRQRDTWVEVSGRARLQVDGVLPDLHVGDEVEVVGQLGLPSTPGNPGEFDYTAALRDQGIGAVLTVRKTAGGVTRLSRGWTLSPRGWLMVVRGWGQRVLGDVLPQRTRGVGMALLLGEGAPMTQDDWDKYLRTGVIHVLAVSGQHLVVLAAFLWFVLPRLGVRQRPAAVAVALFLLAYAVLTGGRPPAMRSAVVVCAFCGGLVLRRRVLPANLFALAWLVVGLLNPMDLSTAGCLLSFLAVAVLYWGTRRRSLEKDNVDPLDVLIEQSRPVWQRGLLWAGKKTLEAYVVCALVWLAVTPLAMSRFHVFPPAGLIIGPPLVLLTSVALLAGFGLLLVAVVWQPLAVLFAPVVGGCLAGCETLVDALDRWPTSHLYISDIPEWWSWIFYIGVLAALTQEPLRRRWPWVLAAGLGWVCVGLLARVARLPDGELRCTFLAVGHGGCTVFETPDGRTLLYDAGAIGGPDVTRRVIAPYLWSRGIRRIDEVFLSHADLDHFNGLVQLLDRFAVGQVTWTPTFAHKPTQGVAVTLAELAKRDVPMQVVKAGDVRVAGDVQLQVLHPPAVGPPGVENVRSLVLQVQHAGHTILLTGDLEGLGQQRVLSLPRRRIDVLMAPHHGSPAANTADLAKWARPGVVVSCQSLEMGRKDGGGPYRAVGARYVDTHHDGAVTVRSHASGLVIETYRGGERIVLRSAPAP